jgi:PAP2 superfamily
MLGELNMTTRQSFSMFEHRFTRRAALARFGGVALGTAALSITGSSRFAAAKASDPVAPVADYGSSVATSWYRLALDLARSTPGFTPPVTSRAFGYLGVTLYEALVPGMPDNQSLAGQLNELTALPPPYDHAYHWPTVANSALAASARLFFPTAPNASKAAIDDLEAGFSDMLTPGVPPGIVKRSVKRGQVTAAHIFNWSTSDGGHEGYLTNFPSSYTPPVGLGLWIPTAPDYQAALQPYWGQHRPFVLASGADHDPGPPPVFSTELDSAFYAEAIEVYETVESLTEEQRDIAIFWADDPGVTATPSGHSVSILTQILEDQYADLATTADAYARVGMAMSDAFISCWHTKYAYNLIRPISYIQQYIDPQWGVGIRALPVSTPPFPEYTSGHSVQAGAFAQVLFDLFGDLPFIDHTHDERGLTPRTFSSCIEMAGETAISRLYGGVHYRSAIELGIEQGKGVGKAISALTFRQH